MNEIIIKKFEHPDEIRNFEKGKFELVKLNDMMIGKATYEPGWKCSLDISPLVGSEFCEIEHYGIVLSGSATVVFPDKETCVLKRNDLFFVPSAPNDSRDNIFNCIF
tara:strand:- start:171 stop:491 length:321 start_codon:yes stop_codon:yes gene_type:complete